MQTSRPPPGLGMAISWLGMKWGPCSPCPWECDCCNHPCGHAKFASTPRQDQLPFVITSTPQAPSTRECLRYWTISRSASWSEFLRELRQLAFHQTSLHTPFQMRHGACPAMEVDAAVWAHVVAHEPSCRPPHDDTSISRELESRLRILGTGTRRHSNLTSPRDHRRHPAPSASRRSASPSNAIALASAS